MTYGTSPLTTMPVAVIFDMDGLILDTETMYLWSSKRAVGELGYKMTDSIYYNMVGRRAVDCKEYLRGEFGDSFPFDEFLIRWDSWDAKYISQHGLGVKPGIHTLLRYLKSIDLITAIATSSSRSRAIEYLGELAKCFDALITSDDVPVAKPSPDIFILAAQRLQVPPKACLVLEDSLLGIIAAQHAKMQCIMVPDVLPPCDYARSMVVAVCASLFNVVDVLRSAHKTNSLYEKED